MSLPNCLTLTRIILAFACMYFVMRNTLASVVIAFFIFLLASLTDFFDGFFARRNQRISDLGKILDPLADKVLIIGVFLSFLQLGIISAWMVAVIMIREFLITGIRFLALSKGVVLEAKSVGKHKMVSQILAIIFIFLVIIFNKSFPHSQISLWMTNYLLPAVMWYVVFVTIYSGGYYLWINRRMIKTY